MVLLNHTIIKECEEVALKRHREVISRGRASDLDDHIVGCYGEVAVCLQFKHFWTNLDDFWIGKFFEKETWKDRSWDTAAGEVRATFSRHVDGIKLYPKDDFLDSPYIWVRLHRVNPNLINANVAGWIRGFDGRVDAWWKEENQCWIYPSMLLKSINSLPIKEIKMNGNYIRPLKETLSRCDYKIGYDGQDYYVWGMKNDGVFIHYHNTRIIPPNDEQDLVFRFLNEQKFGSPCYNSCFE